MCKNLILVWVSVELRGLYLYTEVNNLGANTQGPFLNPFIQHNPKENRWNARLVCLTSLACHIVSTIMNVNVDEP